MHFSKSKYILPLIIFIFLSSSAFALVDGDYTYTESGGYATITDYTGAGGAISIPATLGFSAYPTVAIGDNAFSGKSTVTGVTIPSSVTSIGFNAFRHSGLTSISIGTGVTSIGGVAFFECFSLTSVIIPASVASIGDSAFSHCIVLSGITVDAGNLAYSSQDGVLYNITKKTLIQYPGGKSGPFTIPGSVVIIEDTSFRYCSGLTSVTIPGTVTIIGNMAFGGCTGLTSVNIPGSVTSLEDNAFYDCSNLTGAYFYGNAPTIGSQVFDYCASGFTVYYLAEATGFTNPWYSYPTADFAIYYEDRDGDGYGNQSVTTFGTTVPAGYASVSGDCNDNDSAIHATVIYYPDADGDGYRNADNASAFCSLTPPAGYLENTSSVDADDTDPFYTDFLPTCGVKIIPKTLGWLVGDKAKTRSLLVIGKRGTDFGDNPVIKWESDAIDDVNTSVFFKRFMFMKAKFNGEPLEKKEYRVLVGDCEGKISWAR